VKRLQSSGRAEYLCAALILIVNVLVAWRLFALDYSAHLNTNEGTFIAIARVMAEHPGERLWWPFWDCGMPFQNTYLPLLHILVSLTIRVLHLTPAHAFHAVSAVLYCLGPVALFALVRVMSGKLWTGFLAGSLYSLVSPCALLSPTVRHDLGGAWDLRRLSVLVSYGEGPPTAGLFFLPLAILFAFLLLRCRSPKYAMLAGGSLAGAVLSNAFAGVCAALAVACLLITIDVRRYVKNAGLIAVTGILSYLAISPWLPPSLLATIRSNSPTVDGDYRYTLRSWAGLAGTSAGFALVWWACRRARFSAHAQFFSLFGYLLAAITLLGLEARVFLLPQPHRFQIAMDMAICSVLAIGICALAGRISPRARIAIVLVIAAGLLRQAVHCARYGNRLIRPTDIAQSVEYKAARWMETNMPGRRAMMAGSVSFLYNVFTDNPQLHGGHDPMLPNPFMNAVVFSLYSGMNAGDHEAEYSIVWLKAFGARAVMVPGPDGKEFYKPFAHPGKFEGKLPVLWREGGDTIYGVPARSDSLAHVVPASAIVDHRPMHGVDVEPVLPFITALDDPALPPAQFDWQSLHSARIRARVMPGQVISVQVTHTPGWHAVVNGSSQMVRADGLGLMVIDPHCNGDCEIQLDYDGGSEAYWTRFASVISLGVSALLAVAAMRRRKLQLT
jgi:hypothetical protein